MFRVDPLISFNLNLKKKNTSHVLKFFIWSILYQQPESAVEQCGCFLNLTQVMFSNDKNLTKPLPVSLFLDNGHAPLMAVFPHLLCVIISLLNGEAFKLMTPTHHFRLTRPVIQSIRNQKDKFSAQYTTDF